MTHSYPSNINPEQFDKIKPILESARKKTRPRSIDLYDVFCGVLYVLKSGCQWRMLPKEFPKWRTCHYYFSNGYHCFYCSAYEKIINYHRAHREHRGGYELFS